MHALSAAWLAQMDFTRLDIEALAQHAGEALRLADPDQHAARSRASLVVAQALHLAGRMDLALHWYTRTRDHANAEGDDAAVSAMMHNMAWIRMANMRQVRLASDGSIEAGIHARLGAESLACFDRMIGVSSLDSLKPILCAQILSLEDQCGQALSLYEQSNAGGHLSGMLRLQSDLLSDQALCRIRLGQIQAARNDAIAAESSLLPVTQIDDRAATHSRLALVWAALGDHDAARRHEQLAAQSWRAFGEVQVRIVELLGPMTELGPTRRPSN
jgi:tetratricopeptide (TPR) repeat protein